MNISKEAENIKQSIIKWRRELHKIPEVGLHLPKTQEYIKNKLKEMNIDFTTYENHSGITAVIGKKDGKTIAIRADMDGLPIKEECNIEFKSTTDNMHACGHDGHMAVLLGTAKILKEHEDEINGKIKLIFQPCEECAPGGAEMMIDDGVLENPKVDAILVLHVDNKNRNYKNGDVIVSYKSMFASDDPINIKITGKGGHASIPHECIDPVSIGNLIMNNIQYILSREVKPTIPSLMSFCGMETSTVSNNIIPDSIVIKGTTRNVDNDVRKYVLKRIEELAVGMSRLMKAECEVDFSGGCPAVINDSNIVEKFLSSAKSILNEDEIHVVNDYNMGAEDAGFYFEKVPGCYFLLYNPKAYEDGVVYPAHNSKFMMDDSVLYIGVELFIKAATDILNSSELTSNS
ncbi:MAG: M20 family metallopeptidase [Clostridium sp.]|nr:M20 family metallopeptidase [Clostridium sp.]